MWAVMPAVSGRYVIIWNGPAIAMPYRLWLRALALELSSQQAGVLKARSILYRAEQRSGVRMHW